MYSGSEEHARHGPCKKRLNAIIGHAGIAAALLASMDGKTLAAACDNPAIDFSHVATLSAMTAALNRTPVNSHTTTCRNICISDLGGSPMVILAVGATLLTVIGEHGANMGMVTGIARDAGRNMDACLKSLRQEEDQGTGFVFNAEALTARVLAAIEERNCRLQEGDA
jgi:predicted regulator of Ras-like GTPase activity (Roadblock/LC7/MglB family)